MFCSKVKYDLLLLRIFMFCCKIKHDLLLLDIPMLCGKIKYDLLSLHTPMFHCNNKVRFYLARDYHILW